MTTAKAVGAVSREALKWHAIDWQAINRNVRRLQARIVQATTLRIEAASLRKRRSKRLSRMTGNHHVRFLEGWTPVMGSGYSIIHCYGVS